MIQKMTLVACLSLLAPVILTDPGIFAEDAEDTGGIPVIRSVEPQQVSVDEETQIRLTGEGFQPGASVAWQPGGLSIVGTVASRFARQTHVQAGLAYVVGDDLQIVEVSDPTAPLVVGRVEIGANGADLAEGLAYLVSPDTLYIVDVGDPASPRIVGSVEIPQYGSRVFVAEGVAYVTTYRPGTLQIVDVRDPAAPWIAGSIALPGIARDVIVVNHMAYVANTTGGLQIVDVSDAASPWIIGGLDTPGGAQGLALADDLAFVADGSQGLQIIDVSDPTALRIVGTRDTPGFATGVYVADGLAFVADGREGLHIIDVSQPTAPWIVDSTDPPTPAADVTVADGFVYLATGRTGTQIVDPVSPRLVRSYDVTDSALGVVFWDGLAYVADSWAGIQIVDPSGPVEVAVVGRIDTPGRAFDIAVANGLAFVADGPSGLQILDLGVPAAPVLLGSHDTPDIARGVAVADGLAFLAAAESGLRIFDVSDPAAPIPIGDYDTPRVARDVAVANNLAFVVDGGRSPFSSDLYVLDVTDPTAPSLVESLAVPNAHDLAVSNNLLHLATSNGLQIVDVTDPAAPTLVGGIDTSVALGITLVDDLAYVAGRLAPSWERSDCEVDSDCSNREKCFAERGICFGVNICTPPTIGCEWRSFPPNCPAGKVPTWVGVCPSGLCVWPETCFDWDTWGACGFANLPRCDRSGLDIVDVSDPTSPVVVGRVESHGTAGPLAVAGSRTVVATRGGGLRTVRLNPPLASVTWQSGSEMTATVPRGFVPGPYHLRTSNAEPEHSTLNDAFRACRQREWRAALEPLLPETTAMKPAQGTLPREPLRWRLHIDGDDLLFSERGRPHEVSLRLPELPASMETQYEATSASREMAIELRLAPELGLGEVVLVGFDEDDVGALWRQVREAGGVAMARIDQRQYGDLEVSRMAAALGVFPVHESTGSTPPPYTGVAPASARYRYEFIDGVLTAARFSGPGTDLMFEARARDEVRCEFAAAVSFVEAARTACEELGSARPGLLIDCNR